MTGKREREGKVAGWVCVVRADGFTALLSPHSLLLMVLG